MSIINKVFILFLVFTGLLSVIPGFDISRADFVFNACFLSYSVFLVYLLVREFRSGYKDLKIIIAGLVFVGLTAVKAEVEKLKGTIQVESTKGQGTCFRITVPLLD